MDRTLRLKILVVLLALGVGLSIGMVYRITENENLKFFIWCLGPVLSVTGIVMAIVSRRMKNESRHESID